MCIKKRGIGPIPSATTADRPPSFSHPTRAMSSKDDNDRGSSSGGDGGGGIIHSTSATTIGNEPPPPTPRGTQPAPNPNRPSDLTPTTTHNMAAPGDNHHVNVASATLIVHPLHDGDDRPPLRNSPLHLSGGNARQRAERSRIFSTIDICANERRERRSTTSAGNNSCVV